MAQAANLRENFGNHTYPAGVRAVRNSGGGVRVATALPHRRLGRFYGVLVELYSPLWRLSAATAFSLFAAQVR